MLTAIVVPAIVFVAPGALSRRRQRQADRRRSSPASSPGAGATRCLTIVVGMAALWLLQWLDAANIESGATMQPIAPDGEMTDAFRRHRHLHRHARPDACGQRRGHAGTAAADQGRARHRQDDARRGGGARARPAADAMAHQVDDQGAAGAVRIRRRVAAARLAARRRARRRHRALHQARRAVGGVRSRDARPSC